MKILNPSNSPNKAWVYCVFDNGDTISFESKSGFTANKFKNLLSDEIAERCSHCTDSLTKVLVIGYGFIVEFTPDEALNKELMHASLRKYIDVILMGLYKVHDAFGGKE